MAAEHCVRAAATALVGTAWGWWALPGSWVLPISPNACCLVGQVALFPVYPQAHPALPLLPVPQASCPHVHACSGCHLPLCLSHQVPVIWDHILKKNMGKWEAIAKHQVKHAFSPTEEELKLQARR